MKHLYILTALLSATTLSAQQPEIGINGGIGFNSRPGIISETNTFQTNRKQSGISPVISLKAIMNQDKWQYGVQIDYRQLSYTSVFAPPFVIIPENTTRYQTTFISKEAIPFKAFLNRKFTLKHIETYGGVAFGYLFAAKCEDPNALAMEYYDHVNGHGLVAGVSAGANYSVTKRIRLNAEINADYMWLTIGAATYKLVDVPVTIGVRYRL